MKRFLTLLPLLLLLSAPVRAAEVPVGVITATTTATNNSTTASPFKLASGNYYLIWCDAAGTVAWGSDATVAATSANGFPVSALDKWDDKALSPYLFLSAVATSGTINCYVLQVI